LCANRERHDTALATAGLTFWLKAFGKWRRLGLGHGASRRQQAGE
jgi:hypothetical protein